MSQFKPGKLVTLSRLVHRIVAPNGGMMTGPGTNTYLIGNKEIAVIDPGPADEQHIDAIMQAVSDLNGVIKWILCTHTHPDHSPGSQLLKARTHATLYGQAAPDAATQDHSFQPEHRWQDHETLTTNDFTVRAIYTPGHASNHWCYLLENENLLFTGDHIMNGSTVVIAPPDGNMTDYLDSLSKLKPENIDHIAPGHGDLLDKPQDVIEGTIQHRLMREQKTIEKLSLSQPIAIDSLVKEVYDEVPVFLHSLAKYSLLAHLYKLEADGKAAQQDDFWQLTKA